MALTKLSTDVIDLSGNTTALTIPSGTTSNSNLNAVDWLVVAGGGAGANSGGGFTTRTVMNFTGDGTDTGSTGTFALTPTPSSTANTDIYIAGVYQQKNSYSLANSNEIVFSAAPPVTATNGIEIVITT